MTHKTIITQIGTGKDLSGFPPILFTTDYLQLLAQTAHTPSAGVQGKSYGVAAGLASQQLNRFCLNRYCQAFATPFGLWVLE